MMSLVAWLQTPIIEKTSRRRNRRSASSLPLLGQWPAESLEVRLLLSTLQNFDNAGSGTPFNRFQNDNPPGATEMDGGPTGIGKFLRLVDGVTPPHVNTITFQTSDAGAFNQVIADFDFRITTENTRGDGFSFALLNTANFPVATMATVVPQGPIFAAEEPNYAGSIGIGFDIFKSDNRPGGYPDDFGDNIVRDNFSNSISLHFNSTFLGQWDVSPAVLPGGFDLGSGQWIHARIVMRPGGGFSDVSVILTPNGGSAVTVVNQFAVAGFTPYEGRVHYAARAGGESADFDLDNINAQFMDTSQTLLSISAVSYVVHETQANAQVTVTRTGGSGGPVSVQYSTSNGSAAAGSDYVGIAPTTLSFGAGEMSKIFNVPILNDPNTEGDETFLVSLSNAVGAVVGGASTAGITIFDDETSRLIGNWDNPDRWPVVAIHTHLLPTGEVMFWDRFGNVGLWNPTTDEFSTPQQPGYDVFCSGHAFLPDGSLLVTGGHQHGGDPDDDYHGLETASLYNPFSGNWTELPTMNAGRWYPTNTTLPNGDVLVLSGTAGPNDLNELPQVWQPATGTWRSLTGAQETAPLGVDLYPRMFVLPDGRLFKAGPDQDTWFLDTAGVGAWTAGPAHVNGLRTYGAAVMYAPGKILVMGGGRVGVEDPEEPDATATAEIIDFNVANPVWRTVAPMQFARRQLNATLLPDGKVLVTGGTGGPGFNNEANPVLAAEIWDPETENWSTLSSMQVTRGYHSTAMLLPDGRVISAGGGEGAGATSFHNDAEIFSPPYLFDGLRPTITAAPDAVIYGQTFFVETPDASNITKVSLIRLPSVTHSFDENQRFNSLSFSMTTGGLSVAAPAGSTPAPPGHYMLFILDGNGVPGVGQIIQVTDGAAPSVTLSVAPASVAEAAGVSTITATLSAASAQDLTVYLGFSGTATNVNDYTRSGTQIVITAGNTTGTVTLSAVQDVLGEYNETIVVDISGVTNGTESGTQQATVTIIDDDAPNQVPAITAPPTVNSAQRPVISWTSVPRATEYEIWVTKDPSTSPYHRATVMGTSFTPTFDFGIGKFNLWVRAKNSVGVGPWTTKYTFVINTAATFGVVPRNQTTTTPTLTWSPLAGAVKYDVWIDNRSTGQQQVVRNMNVTGTSFTVTPDLPMGSYRAWVRGKDASGLAAAWSAAVDFNLLPGVTVTGPLISTFDRTPTFTWNAVPGAVGYDLLLRNANTGAVVGNPTNVIGTSYTQPSDLPVGPYRWQILAVIANGLRSQAATTQELFIGGRPNLLSPAGSTSDTTPTFSWTPVAGAASYNLFVNRTDVAVAGIINATGLTTSSYTPVTPLPVGTYRAWVRAVSTTGELSSWSIQVDFTIAAAMGPAGGVAAVDSLMAEFTIQDFMLFRQE